MNHYRTLVDCGVSTVFEAAGRVGLIDPPLRRIVDGSAVAGPARTVRCADGDNLMVQTGLAAALPGEIIVITTPGRRTDVALVGELVASQAMGRGVAGILVDAAIRDIDQIREIGVPVWTRAVTPRGPTRDTAGELDVTLDIGGATVGPGDTVVLDADGGVVVTADRMAEVSEAATARAERENARALRYRSGELAFHLDDLGSLIVTGGSGR